MIRTDNRSNKESDGTRNRRIVITADVVVVIVVLIVVIVIAVEVVTYCDIRAGHATGVLILLLLLLSSWLSL